MPYPPTKDQWHSTMTSLSHTGQTWSVSQLPSKQSTPLAPTEIKTPVEYTQWGQSKSMLTIAPSSSRVITSQLVAVASINSLFQFLGWVDLKVKSIKLQRQIYCQEEKELTKAEYMRLVNTAKQKGNERLNLLIQTICGTGICVSELQYITVEAVRSGEAVVSLKGKTRSVFIVRKLQKMLRYAAEQKITSGAIFITRSGKPMSRTNIWREMKNLCVQAGVNPQKVFPP